MCDYMEMGQLAAGRPTIKWMVNLKLRVIFNFSFVLRHWRDFIDDFRIM